MACEVNNKEINSQCAELLVRPTYMLRLRFSETIKNFMFLILSNRAIAAIVLSTLIN